MTATASSGAASRSSGRSSGPAGGTTAERGRRAKPSVPPEPGRARIIAVANQKGGVGKSTTAVSLGAALADIGYRVLVLDLDPQGNASTGMGIRHEAREITVYDVVVAEASLDAAIVGTAVPRLEAVPSTIDLAGAEIELVSQFSRETRLKRALEPVLQGRYDFILLDCPPSLGLLTVNALTAAEELIVPIQCEYYALEGLGQLLRNVSLVQQNINPGLRLAGIVMTMFDPRTKLSEQVVAEVRRFFGDLVYDVIIPRTVRLSEAPGFGQPITLYDPRSKGAEAYRELAREVAVRPVAETPIPAMEDLPTVVIAAPPAAAPPTQPEPDADEGDDEDDAPIPSVHQIEERFEPESEPATSDTEEEELEDQAIAEDVAEAVGAALGSAEDAPPSAAGSEDELWEEEPEALPEQRVRPVRPPDPDRSGGPPPPRVVVIEEHGGPADTVAEPGPDEDAQIGATLHDDGVKRRWKLFRKGGED